MYNTTPPPTPAPPSPPLIIPRAPSTPPSEHTASTVTAASPETINALIATHDGLLLPPPSPPLPPHTSDSTPGVIALSAIVTKMGTKERLKALMFDLKANSEIPFPLSKHWQKFVKFGLRSPEFVGPHDVGSIRREARGKIQIWKAADSEALFESEDGEGGYRCRRSPWDRRP
jgi:hypothetical protein